jgi:hypothetical protein
MSRMSTICFPAWNALLMPLVRTQPDILSGALNLRLRPRSKGSQLKNLRFKVPKSVGELLE